MTSNARNTGRAVPQPQPIRRTTTEPLGHQLRRVDDLISGELAGELGHRHKRGARSVSNDELLRAKLAPGPDSPVRETKEGASLWRRVSKAGTSSLKSISGSVRRATSVRLTRSRGSGDSSSAGTTTTSSTRPARGKHGRSLSDAQARQTREFRKDAYTNLLSSGISEDSPVPEGDDELEMDSNVEDVKVPILLQEGTPMTKVSAKKKKTVMFRIDPDQGYILWDSKKSGLIPIENIKEIRSGADARYYREQFQLSQEYEDRWLTIVYIVDGRYKTLHVVAVNKDVFAVWDRTVRDLYSVRLELMSGLGHVEKRQAVWERRYWKSADEQRDDKLTFDEVEKMCKRLNISFSQEDLLRRFKEADAKDRGYLDFDDFRRFVKLLKDRPEITRLFKRLVASKNDVFDFSVFELFMVYHQKSSLSKAELEVLFRKYVVPPKVEPAPTNPPDAPAAPSEAPPVEQLVEDISKLVWTLDTFTSFLLSTDNAVFYDQHSEIWHDMTRPLPEYFISSSHNTYLVGHQLVGVSTIEGYIRALLHSCRSVELDIYDGETSPVIYHGKTFTSKVPLRDICEAIAKYAFVASPYPIIISAEVHCSLAQQDLIAKIMQETFGDSLIQAPVEGRPKIEQLPSPQDLKGKVLLKAKNLYLTAEKTEKAQNESTSTDTTDTADTSASDSEFIRDVKQELNHEMSAVRSVYAVKEIREEIQKIQPMKEIKEMKHEIKEEVSKARALYDRVRRKKSPSPVGRHLSPSIPPVVAIASSTSSALATPSEPPKVKMSIALVALLVYTVGVKCRGINKKETYAPEHLFSLSERMATKVMKQSLFDLVKHNKTHLVRIYPSGTRLNSSNYEPHKFWCAGAQLVAINWQTFDLGYMINHAMFQRNGRAGYVLKPEPLRNPSKDALSRRTSHFLDLKIISAQQLPRRKDSVGREIVNNNIIDPYVEVTIHAPDWSRSPFVSEAAPDASYPPSSSSPPAQPPSPSKTTTTLVTYRTSSVKNNGFNPVWEERLSIPFDCVADMLDLIFVRFTVKDDNLTEDDAIAVYCVPLGSLQQGYRHLPLHDAQLSQYLFSTLFVKIGIRDNAVPPNSP